MMKYEIGQGFSVSLSIAGIYEHKSNKSKDHFQLNHT